MNVNISPHLIITKFTNSILDAKIESKKIVDEPDSFAKRRWFRWIDINIDSKTRIKDRKR